MARRGFDVSALVLVAAFAAIACGASASPDAQRAQAAKSSSLPRPVRLARADAADRAAIAVSRVRVISVKRRVWPNGCFGLPAPELCPRTRTPGYRAVFSVRGKHQAYRTDLKTSYRLEE
jgi:hypothetical protein